MEDRINFENINYVDSIIKNPILIKENDIDNSIFDNFFKFQALKTRDSIEESYWVIIKTLRRMVEEHVYLFQNDISSYVLPNEVTDYAEMIYLVNELYRNYSEALDCKKNPIFPLKGELLYKISYFYTKNRRIPELTDVNCDSLGEKEELTIKKITNIIADERNVPALFDRIVQRGQNLVKLVELSRADIIRYFDVGMPMSNRHLMRIFVYKDLIRSFGKERDRLTETYLHENSIFSRISKQSEKAYFLNREIQAAKSKIQEITSNVDGYLEEKIAELIKLLKSSVDKGSKEQLEDIFILLDRYNSQIDREIERNKFQEAVQHAELCGDQDILKYTPSKKREGEIILKVKHDFIESSQINISYILEYVTSIYTAIYRDLKKRIEEAPYICSNILHYTECFWQNKLYRVVACNVLNDDKDFNTLLDRALKGTTIKKMAAADWLINDVAVKFEKDNGYVDIYFDREIAGSIVNVLNRVKYELIAKINSRLSMTDSQLDSSQNAVNKVDAYESYYLKLALERIAKDNAKLSKLIDFFNEKKNSIDKHIKDREALVRYFIENWNTALRNTRQNLDKDKIYQEQHIESKINTLLKGIYSNQSKEEIEKNLERNVYLGQSQEKTIRNLKKDDKAIVSNEENVTANTGDKCNRTGEIDQNKILKRVRSFTKLIKLINLVVGLISVAGGTVLLILYGGFLLAPGIILTVVGATLLVLSSTTYIAQRSKDRKQGSKGEVADNINANCTSQESYLDEVPIIHNELSLRNNTDELIVPGIASRNCGAIFSMLDSGGSESTKIKKKNCTENRVQSI